MITINLRGLAVAVLLLATMACTHPIEIVGRGDVLSSSGTRHCFLEQQRCEFTISGEYTETYTARPRPGHEFVRWESCLDAQGSRCQFNVPRSVVRQNAYQTAPALKAFFAAQTAPASALRLSYSAPPFFIANANYKFVPDISYGVRPRQKLDIFLPTSGKPTGLVMYFHEGGFITGDKSLIYDLQRRGDIGGFLRRGIAFATVNYRYLATGDPNGLLTPLNDAKRALQFLRYHSLALNIDKTKVVVYGNSAGAGASLWLAFNDDLADFTNIDPVLHQSTRVLGVAALETQATFDFLRWPDDVFQDFDLSLETIASRDPGLQQRMLQSFGVNSLAAMRSNAKVPMRRRLDMLGMMSRDDPEMFLANLVQPAAYPQTQSNLVHHPLHARALNDRANQVGLEHVVYIPKLNIMDPSNESHVQFLRRKLSD